MHKTTMRIAIISLVLPLFAACGGGGGGGGGSTTASAPEGPYDLEFAVFGQQGVSRNFTLDGEDNNGNQYTADLSRITPDTKPTDSPCIDGETHLDTGLTLTVTFSDGSSDTTVVDTDNCWTVGNDLIFQFARTLQDGSTITYEQLATGAGIPASATIGEGGTFASTTIYEESNGTSGLQTTGDTFDGTKTSSWKLVDDNGQGQLVVTTVKKDTGGTTEFTEVTKADIDTDGSVKGYAIRIEYGPGSSLDGLIVNLST